MNLLTEILILIITSLFTVFLGKGASDDTINAVEVIIVILIYIIIVTPAIIHLGILIKNIILRIYRRSKIRYARVTPSIPVSEDRNVVQIIDHKLADIYDENIEIYNEDEFSGFMIRINHEVFGYPPKNEEFMIEDLDKSMAI